MGDRYIMDVECAYCREVNRQVMFADDWSETMRCKECGKISDLKWSFTIESVKRKRKKKVSVVGEAKQQ